MRLVLLVTIWVWLLSGALVRAQSAVSTESELERVVCRNAAVPIRISVPDTFKVNGCDDTISVIHPNALCFPDRFAGYKLWCVFSVMSGTHCDENTFLRVSNDGQTWIRLPGSPDPLSWRTDFVDSSQGQPPAFVGSIYASDPDLFLGVDGKLWVITRAFFEGGGKRAALYARWSEDGAHWSPNRRITPFVRGDATLLSPSVFRDSSGRYVMWSVSYNNEPDGRVRGRIEVRTASTPDGNWELSDTAREYGTGRAFPAGNDTNAISDDSIWDAEYTPWHLGMIDNPGGEEVVLLTAKNNGVTSRTHPLYVDFIGLVHDYRSLSLRREPLLLPSFASHSPDSMYVYKATGWLESDQGHQFLNVLYSGKGTHLWHTALARSDFGREPDSLTVDTSAAFAHRARPR